MIDRARHVPLRPLKWDPDKVAASIEDIVSDAIAHFEPDRLWPAQPLDETSDGQLGFYFGATGIIWALDYLRNVGATKAEFEFRPSLGGLLEASKAPVPGYEDYAPQGSFLNGDFGTALLAMRLSPTPDLANYIHTRASANTDLPIRELMWGMPGSMLACIHMAEMTGDARWRSLFITQANRLLDDLEESERGPLWTQDLYGRTVQYLGPVHGYAGNMIPLMRAWEWLSKEQRGRVAEAVPRTLAANACRSEFGVTWHPRSGSFDFFPPLCQHCHGAPGIVTAFADAPFSTPELETLLVEGGNYTWAAGPLAKGSNLCHGTGGNGYAFLKLFRRTGDPVWLERARAFAMTAIAQCEEAREDYGRGRHSLWTGDVGLAIFLWDCLTGKPYFPTIYVF
jgi:hypothetical protein